jgi:hypothetical protein
MPSAVPGPHPGTAYDEGPKASLPDPWQVVADVPSGKAIACAPIANKSAARKASR